MKHDTFADRDRCYAWRPYGRRQGRAIEGQLSGTTPPCCPECGTLLEARPDTRIQHCLVLGARGYDLDCRDCRRFWCVVRHTPRSLRLLGMRRLAAAVGAVDASPRPARRASAADGEAAIVA